MHSSFLCAYGPPKNTKGQEDADECNENGSNMENSSIEISLRSSDAFYIRTIEAIVRVWSNITRLTTIGGVHLPFANYN